MAVLAAVLMLAAAGCGKKGGNQQQTSAAEARTTARTEQTTAVEDQTTAQQSIAETAGAAETTAAPETQHTASEKETETESEPKSEETTTEQQTVSGPRYYTLADLADLKNTEHFNSSAIEHIFNGTVNSQGKGSGYHYDMIEDSDGKIIEGTRSEKDKNGLYTAYVEVAGHKKDHYSTFYPDEWSPQETVDAINEAYDDAISNHRVKGSTWIGYCGDIEIDMYLDSKDRIVSAFPVHEDDKR